MKKRLWILAVCLTLAMLAAVPAADTLRARGIRKSVQKLGALKNEEALFAQLGRPHEIFTADDPFMKVYVYNGPAVLTSMLNNEWPFFHPSLLRSSWSVRVFVVASEYQNELNELNAELRWGPRQFNRAISFNGNAGG